MVQIQYVKVVEFNAAVPSQCVYSIYGAFLKEEEDSPMNVLNNEMLQLSAMQLY